MKNKPVLTVSIFFFAFIFLFAFIYFLLFRINTANFYIAEEFNEKVNKRYIERERDVLYDIPDLLTGLKDYLNKN